MHAAQQVRLAWHSSGTYDKMSKSGGSGGGTIRFKEELAHGANAGLDKAVAWLEPVHKKHPQVSYADLYTLAGAESVEAMGGPAVPWRAGRVDAMTPDAVTPDGRLPEADAGRPEATAASLRQVFGRMGFDDREIVALSGAHALGRCHAENSGYVGPWQGAPTIFSNVYFKLLAKQTKAEYWTPDDRYSKLQYRDKSGTLSASHPRSGFRFVACSAGIHCATLTAALSDAALRPGAGAGRRLQEARAGVCQGPGGAAAR